MPDTSDTRGTAALRFALPRLAAGATHDLRVASARRTELTKLLAAKEFSKLAEADTELSTAATRVSEALADEDKAAAAWQKALAEATKDWEAMLTELSKLHPEES